MPLRSRNPCLSGVTPRGRALIRTALGSALLVAIVGCATPTQHGKSTGPGKSPEVSSPPAAARVPPQRSSVEQTAPPPIFRGNKLKIAALPTRERPELGLKAYADISVGDVSKEEPLSSRFIEVVPLGSRKLGAKTCVTGDDGVCRINLIRDFGLGTSDLDSKTRLRISGPSIPGVDAFDITIDNADFLQPTLVVEIGQHRLYGSADYSKPLNAEIRKGEKLPVVTIDKTWLCLKAPIAGLTSVGCVPRYVGRLVLEAPNN